MTDLNEMKKIQKYKDKVYRFLEEHRHTEENKERPTHVAYGNITGKFYMDNEEREEFMRLYIKALDNNVNDMPILEAQSEWGPLIIDVDLEQPIEDYKGGRLYDEKLINNLIRIYVKAIDNYLIVKKEDYRICVFEKSKPMEKESTFRDGFHIMFPQTCVQTRIRHLIRVMAVKLCKEEELFSGYTQPVEKIIDKSVVSSNNWFIYGSKKPNGHVYKLKKIYNNNLDIIYDHDKGIMYDADTGAHVNYHYDNEKLVKYFSLYSKKFQKKKATELGDLISESDIEVECNEHGINTNLRNDIMKHDIPCNKEDEIRKAYRYTNMLSGKRAEDYHDWVRVGLVLHNIDLSLLAAWVEFSKKCDKKFKEGECEKMWRTMKNPSTGNLLTIRSLAFWAKQDDPKQYEVFNREEFKNIMNKSLNGNTYFLAKSIHAKYSDRYICSSIKNNTWWEFKNHKWVRIDEGYTLKMQLSEDFANEYNKEISEISIMITKASGVAKEELTRRRSSLDTIVSKLMNNTFKKTLMDECKALFYDDLFDRKLDENTNLVGFENGVYDLEQNIFREGRPDDYITLSTKNYYQKWSDKNPYKNKILDFLSKILPNERVRKYFIHALCTCLCGDNKEEKLYILTGCGSNGKSLTMDLMYHALGDYYMSCPITIITRKRGTSNETSPEKVRMKGKRCGVFQETDDGEKLNVGVMKEFTGGDKVLVRDLFKGSNEMIEFKPQMKFFLTCNQLPAVPSNDDGTWRRLRIIDFNSKFTDSPSKPNEFMIDNTLKQKIPEWGPSFLSYLLHIYNTEYKNMTYLADPVEVMTSTKQYKMENDFYTEYIMDRIIVTNNDKDYIKSTPLWEDFKAWFISAHTNSKLPKKTEYVKFLNKQFNEPTKKGYTKITFNNNKDESSDNDVVAEAK